MRGPAALLVLSVVMSAPVLAQPSQNTIIATEAFDRGLKLAGERRWKEACTAFEQSQRAEAAFGTQYNLAGCYVQIGKLASAWAAYNDLAQRDTNAARKQDAASKASALLPRVPKLLITAPDAPADLTITVDGAPAFPGTPIPVDLGAHAVIAKAPKHAEKSYTPSVTREGETVTVEVRLLPHAEPVPDASTGTTSAPTQDTAISWAGTIEDTTEQPGKKPLWTKLVIGGGVTLTGVGLGFGVAAWVNKSEAHDKCDDGMCFEGSTALRDANNQLETARSRALYSTIFTLSGVAVIGLGVVLAVTADDEHHTSPAISLGAGDSPLGLTFGGAF